MKKIVFTVIASRDAEFFINVAKQLDFNKYEIIFYSFYSPAEKKIREAGYECFIFRSNKLNTKVKSRKFNTRAIEVKYRIKSLCDLILHERMTFNYHDESYLLTKCQIYLEGLDSWLNTFKPDVVIQELGGFIAPMSF